MIIYHEKVLRALFFQYQQGIWRYFFEQMHLHPHIPLEGMDTEPGITDLTYPLKGALSVEDRK